VGSYVEEDGVCEQNHMCEDAYPMSVGATVAFYNEGDPNGTNWLSYASNGLPVKITVSDPEDFFSWCSFIHIFVGPCDSLNSSIGAECQVYVPAQPLGTQLNVDLWGSPGEITISVAIDTDGDGVADGDPWQGGDNAPNDPHFCRDDDYDTCDDCDSGSYNPSADGQDTDGDGICDAGDDDADGDGVPDDEQGVDTNFCTEGQTVDCVQPTGCLVSLDVGGGGYAYEVSWTLTHDGEVVAQGGADEAGILDLSSGSYTLLMEDSYGDGWNGNTWTLSSMDGTHLVTQELDDGYTGTAAFVVNCIDGNISVEGGDGGTDPTDENGGGGDPPTVSCYPGTVIDCSGDGDCCSESWIGDGYADCQEQAWGCDLTCYENDGGDCD